jgi:mercuric ion transport protein
VKEKLASISSILTTALAGACCIGPLILIPLGLTSLAGTLAVTFREYTWWLYGIAFIFLTISYLSTRQSKSRINKILFRISTVMIFSFFLVTVLLEFRII